MARKPTRRDPPHPANIAIGNLLTERAHARGITFSKLADELGLDEKTLRAVRKGEQPLAQDLRFTAAEILGLHLDELEHPDPRRARYIDFLFSRAELDRFAAGCVRDAKESVSIFHGSSRARSGHYLNSFQTCLGERLSAQTIKVKAVECLHDTARFVELFTAINAFGTAYSVGIVESHFVKFPFGQMDMILFDNDKALIIPDSGAAYGGFSVYLRGDAAKDLTEHYFANWWSGSTPLTTESGKDIFYSKLAALPVGPKNTQWAMLLKKVGRIDKSKLPIRI